MRYSLERRDGSWFEHELISPIEAAEVAAAHQATVIELAWRDTDGRAATRLVYCITADNNRRTVAALAAELARVQSQVA